MYAVNGTMRYAFENIVNCSRESLPKVDSVVYEDEQGLMAWVNVIAILILSPQAIRALKEYEGRLKK